MTPLFCLYHLAILLCFTCWWVGEKRAQVFFFSCSVHFGFFCQLTKLHLEVHISRQVVSPHVTVNRSANECWVFDTLAGIKSSNPWQDLSIHCVPAHAAAAPVQLRSIEHVRKYNCVASNMCSSTVASHRTCAQVQLRSIEHVRKCI